MDMTQRTYLLNSQLWDTASQVFGQTICSITEASVQIGFVSTALGQIIGYRNINKVNHKFYYSKDWSDELYKKVRRLSLYNKNIFLRCSANTVISTVANKMKTFILQLKIK